MNHVCKRVSWFSAFSNHSIHRLPGVTVPFHCANNFQDCFNIFYIFFYELSLTPKAFLLLNQSADSFFLVFSDLFILFPSQLFESFLLFMSAPLILGKIFSHSWVETIKLLLRMSLQFAVGKRRKLKILFPFAIEIALLFGAEEWS